jgi:hypothetical protein
MTFTKPGFATPAPSRAVVRVVLVAAVALAAGLACSGSTDSVANLDTVTYKSTLFAINGSPAGAPTAISTPTAFTVRAEVGYDFDVAFDLDGSGRPVVLTQRAIGNPLGSAGHQVSLQPLAGTFASVTEAPRDGWVADSTLTLTVGQVLGVRAGATACQLNVSPYMYSKMVVDSIGLAQRQLWLTVVTDPNCGFRSFAAGRPRR